MNKNTELLNLLSEIKEYISDEKQKLITEFIDHNEPNLAFEFICDFLSDSNVKLTHDHYMKIESLGNHLNVDPTYWTSLK